MELTVEGLAAGGRGVARPDGKVWFVAGGLPGDRVEALPVRDTGSFVEARVERIIAPSAQRRAPECGLQPICGGCPWMPLDEDEQREWKSRLVVDALARLGGIEAPSVDPVQYADPALGYRNKVEFSLGRDPDGRAAVGLHRVGAADQLVDVATCPIQSAPANGVLATARRLLLARASDAGLFDGAFRLVLRTTGDGKVLCAIRETRLSFPGAEAFAKDLCAAHPEVVGVVRIRSLPGRRGGSRTEVVRGRGSVRERIAGIKFVLPAATFTQINPAVAARLTRHLDTLVGDAAGLVAIDLYGGVGVLGLALARRGASVTVCEADREAVHCGRTAAHRAGLRNVKFVHGQVRKFLAASNDRVDLIVANPPRQGLGPGIVAAIAARRPQRVLMVSCDPPTLARDVKQFAGLGYALDRVTPFDMFPQTAHIETVVALSRSPNRA